MDQGLDVPRTLTLGELEARIGQEIGASPWYLVDQARIDVFADVTEDPQFIHIDPVAAKARTPFGGTIAHGFLSLSLLSAMAYAAVPSIAGRKMGINYGFDRIRFLSPVASGSRVRGRFRLDEIKRRGADEVLLRYHVSVDIEGHEKPALIADWLVVAVFG